MFDLFVLSIIGLSAMFAWIRGLSREVVTLLAIGAGVGAIALFGPTVSALFGSGIIGPLLGLAAVFLIGFVFASLALEAAVTRVLGAKPVRADKIAGAVFGAVRGWFLLGLVYLALTYYFDETRLPPSIDRAVLRAPVAAAADMLGKLGLEREPDSDPTTTEEQALRP